MSSTAKRKLDDVEENVEGEVDEKKKKRKIQRCDTKEVNATAESISTILKTKSPEKSDSTTTTNVTNADEKKEEPVIESGFLAFADTNPWATTSATNEDSKETNSWDTTTNTDSKETNDNKSEGDSNNASWKFTMDDFSTNDTTSWDFSGYVPPTENKDEKDKSKEDPKNDEESKDSAAAEVETSLSYQKKLSNGEDNERVFCEIGQVKLYRLDNESSEWVSCGEGRVRINVPTSSSEDSDADPRIIMRNMGTNRVILNDLLRPQTEFKLDGTRIRITFVRPSSSVTFVLKFTRNLQRASEFAKAMTTLQKKASSSSSSPSEKV